MSSHAVFRANSLVVLFAIASGIALALSLGGADGAMAGFGAALVALLSGGVVTSRVAAQRG
jgi:hypothetical protein